MTTTMRTYQTTTMKFRRGRTGLFADDPFEDPRLPPFVMANGCRRHCLVLIGVGSRTFQARHSPDPESSSWNQARART